MSRQFDNDDYPAIDLVYATRPENIAGLGQCRRCGERVYAEYLDEEGYCDECDGCIECDDEDE